jgi:hypothetical protein
MSSDPHERALENDQTPLATPEELERWRKIDAWNAAEDADPEPPFCAWCGGTCKCDDWSDDNE